MTTLTDKFSALEADLNESVFERQREIHAMLNALVSQKHFFMIGPPGVGKSYMIRELVDRVDFSDSHLDNPYFQWLLTKYTTPEEVLGPPSIVEMEKGNYVRVTDRKLPTAAIAFLDEIFKANSSILNALLTISNERLFFNGADEERVPLSSIFAASNEMPADDGLWALWDRLHFRFNVGPLHEPGNFIRMLDTHNSTTQKDVEKFLTWNDILEAQEGVKQVKISTEILEIMRALRDDLAAKGIEPSERRFAECLPIIQAEAYLNGRDEVEVDDLRILRHVMWGRPEDARVAERVILELANPLEKEALDILERVEKLDKDLNKVLSDADNDNQAASQSVEIWTKLKKAKITLKELHAKIEESGRKSEIIDLADAKVNEVATRVMKDGFKGEL